MITWNNTARLQLAKLPSRVQPLVMIIHDWLAFFSDDTYLWDQYGTSLFSVITEKTNTGSPVTQSWINHVVGGVMSNKTLLYRHYLLANLVSRDIDLDVGFVPLYQLIASTFMVEVSFAPVEFSGWVDVTRDSHPINRLRQNQPVIENYFHTLAMGEHHLPDQLVADHGGLFSASLLYGMYLAYVILAYEASVDPNPELLILNDHLHDAVSHMKGALCHGPSQWR